MAYTQQKPIVIHRPSGDGFPNIVVSLNNFMSRLGNCFETAKLDYSFSAKAKDKELRRNPDFNHIIFHTHGKKENWLNTQLAYLMDYFYLDPEGFSGWSQIRRLKFDPNEIDANAANEYYAALTKRFIDPKITKIPLGLDKHQADMNVPDGAIVVMLQCAGDQT